MGVLPCVSIIAESHIMRKIYLFLTTQSTVELLLFEQATLSEPLFFKDPYFFKAIILVRKSFFFRRCCLLEQLVSTAKLVFTVVTLFIYRLEINPGDFRFKLPEGTQSGAPLRKCFH